MQSKKANYTGIFIMTTVAAAAAAGTPQPAVAQTPPPAAAAQPRQSTVLKGKAPVSQETLNVQLPKPKTYTLKSSDKANIGGAKVMVVEDHRLPLVTITVSVRGGSLFESTDKPGVADFTAELITQGTTSRTYEQISQETERIGATLTASAGGERASLTASGNAENTDQLVALLADALLNPTFPEERLKQVKFQSIAQLAQQQSNPGFLAGELARRVYYGANTPFGRPTPTPAQLQAITQQDLKTYHAARYHNAPDTLIGVAGDVKPNEIYDKLQKALAGWKPATGTNALPTADFTPKEKTAIYLVDRPGSAQTALSFGNIGIRRTDPDYFPLLLANRILGGDANGRLFQKLREDKGYTYGAYSSLAAPKYPGIWGASANVRNAVTAPAVGEFLNEFARLQSEPVSDRELSVAKKAIVGSFALSLESPSGILSRLLDVVDYGLPADYWDEYPKKVQAVTAQDIQRVAKQYMGTGRIQLIAVGERKEIEEGLAKYGPITVLTPEQVTNPAPATSAP
jgi:predicted Zn-dependent peptidase